MARYQLIYWTSKENILTVGKTLHFIIYHTERTLGLPPGKLILLNVLRCYMRVVITWQIPVGKHELTLKDLHILWAYKNPKRG